MEMGPEGCVRVYQVDKGEDMHFKGRNSWCKGRGAWRGNDGVQLELESAVSDGAKEPWQGRPG